ncbi:class I SAM-dependent methyltransferase [Paenibacillus chitinolyticus]|uniref:class I SAM-dependent methyltransferase n=1 Tax=Paenibacillus chitinolyticus TaxID=79263 RepID=UPI001C48D5E5|nr:class I SAM-dependent methyltransferase [Paenibacillus chitinolyticus]MBV6716433.1 methyltransferase domain-containing protein [Paenibacillus chitinolyticus]
MCSEPSNNHWNSKAYQDNPDFVVKPGAEVLSLLLPQSGERILDVGCGTGDLTAKIAAVGAVPTGIDLSEEMVRRAGQKYPELNFQVEDVCHYRTDVRYDAVFSNAVLHWIKDAPAAARTIWLTLREGGRFVAEFAGRGNVAALTTAMEQELEAHGYTWAGRSPWYFPTIGEYASLLEQTGFRVMLAQHFDKPTPLKGDIGVRKWLDSFADYFFRDVTLADKASIYRAIEAKVKPHLVREGQWMMDTSRLRIVAVKESLD